jgi:hypothetical protein
MQENMQRSKRDLMIPHEEEDEPDDDDFDGGD